MTSVAVLKVHGNGALAPASLEVTRLGSTPQAILVNNPSGGGSISIGGQNIAQVSVSASTGFGAYFGQTSGDAVPFQAGIQTTHPNVTAAHDGGFGFESTPLGGADPTRAYFVIDGNKRYVPFYDTDYVRINAFSAGVFDFSGDVSARTTFIGPLNFDQWNAPQQGGTPLYFTIGLEYSSVSSGADMWVALYNNAVLVRRFFLSLHGQTTIQQAFVRGEYSGAATLMGNSFSVEGYKNIGGGADVHVENVTLSIESR